VSEIEIPILILLNDINLIKEKIKELISRNGYKATEAETFFIHDEYYDTQSNVLKKIKSNLRIRSTDNKSIKITLKQEKEKNESYFDRTELEKSWSYPFYEELLNHMESISNQFHNSRDKYDDDPKKTFYSLGLNIILKKYTKRSIINAVNSTTSQKEFEFAFDYVSIFVDPKNLISFLELEIESKNKGNQTKINQFVDDIVKDENFRQWLYNKLETGLAAKSLYEKDELEKIKDYDKNHVLTRTGLGKIESYLNNTDLEYP
jgi:inorganic triphosphatase YgiF